jgi:hypothetical protein
VTLLLDQMFIVEEPGGLDLLFVAALDIGKKRQRPERDPHTIAHDFNDVDACPNIIMCYYTM